MSQQLRFCLNPEQSPTHFNLSCYLLEQNWRSTSLPSEADFSDDNLQFDLEAAQQLEFKHLLAQLVAKYCPEVMPRTYCINDQNWPKRLDQLAQHYYFESNQLVNQREGLIWILKPALLNNGKEIKIFQKLNDLEQHFLSSKRLGGEHVLQRYLVNPHLLRDQRKYSIRLFVITSNYAGSFIYPRGYYNVALHPFRANNFEDLRPHLTNEHLQDHEANVIQIPAERFSEFASLFPQIKGIVTAVIKGLEQENPQAFSGNKLRNLAIYGFDFLVDAQGKVWLIEANHGPCFPLSDEHPLQKYLYYDFWQAFIAEFVLPIATKMPKDSIHYSLFQKLQTRLKLE